MPVNGSFNNINVDGYVGAGIIIKNDANSGPDPYQETDNAEYKLGTKLIYNDRSYRYAKSGEPNNAGVLLQTSLLNSNNLNLSVQTATTVNSDSIIVTLGSSSVYANEYSEGYIHINNDTSDLNSQGKIYRIKSHEAASGSANLILTLYDIIPFPITTTAKVDLVKNIYCDLIIASILFPATTGSINGASIGVTPRKITSANKYFWVQTGGPSSLLLDEAAPQIGGPVFRSLNSSSPGTVRGFTSPGDYSTNIRTEDDDLIGRCLVTNNIGDNIVVLLNLDW